MAHMQSAGGVRKLSQNVKLFLVALRACYHLQRLGLFPFMLPLFLDSNVWRSSEPSTGLSQHCRFKLKITAINLLSQNEVDHWFVLDRQRRLKIAQVFAF